MVWDLHGYKMGANEAWINELPTDRDALDNFIAKARKNIEPWLSAVLQSEHTNLLIGSGFTTAVCYQANSDALGMSRVNFDTEYDAQINTYAKKSAAAMGRGDSNIEDQFRSALMLLDGIKVLGDAEKHNALKTALSTVLHDFLRLVLATENGIDNALDNDWQKGVSALQSFLLSFASRSASRERLHVFTTNYDRLIEYGCDLAGIRIIDRFVGALNPVFRATRVEVDMHYNPPGIRGEPRFMEGVIRLTKLHGSLDWHINARTKQMHRVGIPFGADATHPGVPEKPIDTVMIYPNPAKDVETTEYPYAELFRDFASALCRPNSVVVLYGYGFGDDHVNRVLLDMLTIPSTHMVIISFGMSVKDFARAESFYNNAARPAQISLLVGPHFANLENLVTNYLPKPAIDVITGRMMELLKNRRPPKTDTNDDFSPPLPPIVPLAPQTPPPLAMTNLGIPIVTDNDLF